MSRLLDSVKVEGASAEADPPDVSVRSGLEIEREDPVHKAAFQEEFLVLLNRQERRRLERRDDQIHVMDEDGLHLVEGVSCNAMPAQPFYNLAVRPRKVVRKLCHLQMEHLDREWKTSSQ